MEWIVSQSVGHSSIDGEHGDLIDVLNRLIAAIEAQPAAGDIDPVSVLAVAADFFDQFCRHSVREEAIMTAFDYPHTAKHAQHHRFMIDSLRILLVDQPDLCAIRVNLPFIRSAVVDHIDQDDRDFGRHLRNLDLFGKV